MIARLIARSAPIGDRPGGGRRPGFGRGRRSGHDDLMEPIEAWQGEAARSGDIAGRARRRHSGESESREQNPAHGVAFRISRLSSVPSSPCTLAASDIRQPPSIVRLVLKL